MTSSTMLQKGSTDADTDSAPEPLPLATGDSKCVGAAKTRPEYHGQKKEKTLQRPRR
jgi:hypothetical protein